RQGLRGGLVVSGVAAVVSLVVASWLAPPEFSAVVLQGHLLAQCGAALLVSSSTSWIRSSEGRYRRVVAHIPVVLTSARFRPAGPRCARRGVNAPVLQQKLKAEVTFISPACKDLFGCRPDELLGDHELWLQRVEPDDREILLAAVAQLSRQDQPVTCEY